MTLRPTDMMEIQSAIDEYERKYPRRPAPSAEMALAWRLGKREAARHALPPMKAAPARLMEPAAEIVQQECGRLTWAWEQIKLQWNMWRGVDFRRDPTPADNAPPWVDGVLRVGWWGIVAAVSVTVFAFGAVIGGLK